MCDVGRSSNGVSIALSRTLAVSLSGHPPPNRLDPHSEQKVFAVPSAGWNVRRSPCPASTRIALDGTRPFAVPTPPEIFLQFVQWQNVSRENGSVISNWTAPQRQLPASVATAAEATLEPMPTRDEVIEALRQVEDPELGMDIVDLGLLYDVEVENGSVKVTHSLTSMGCPVGPMIQEEIHNVTASLPGVERVEVDLVWDPPWTPERMSDDAKFILGFG